MELKNLLRPPVGYFYEVWLSGATNVSLGPLTTPFPDYESLLNADVQEGGVVVGTFIRDAALAEDRQRTRGGLGRLHVDLGDAVTEEP